MCLNSIDFEGNNISGLNFSLVRRFIELEQHIPILHWMIFKSKFSIIMWDLVRPPTIAEQAGKNCEILIHSQI